MCVSSLSTALVRNHVVSNEERVNSSPSLPDWKTLFFLAIIPSICKVIPGGFREIDPKKAQRAFYEVQKKGEAETRFFKSAFKHEHGFEKLLNAGYYGLANALLGPGFDIHRTYSRGQSGISLAAASLEPTIVAELISKGASVNGRLEPTDHKLCLEMTPLMAAMQPHPLWRYDEPEQERRQLEVIQLLIKHQADVNIQKKDGMTPLIFAAYLANSTFVEILLENKADVNLQAEDGETAMIAAARVIGSNSILLALLTAGANISHVNQRGETALTCAMDAHCLQNVSFLLEVGALKDASESYRQKIVSLTLDMGDCVIKEKLLSIFQIEFPRKNVKRRLNFN